MMSEFEMNTKLVQPLYKLQEDYLKLKAEFYKEVHALERKYERSYKPIYDARAKIVNDYYQTSQDDHLARLSLDSPGTLGDGANSVSNTEGCYFWLKAMKNAEMLTKLIQPNDEPILKHLTDISVDLSESDPMAFTLQFHFAPNDYFTNTVLTKEFILECNVPDEYLLGFDGPKIVACNGCHIDWKGGFSSRNANQDDYNSDVPTLASFFDFFKPSKPLSVDEKSSSEEDYEMLSEFSYTDSEIGNFIRERFVPGAVMYFEGDLTTTGSNVESEFVELGEDVKTILDMVEDDDEEEEKEETDAGEVMRQAQTVKGVVSHEEEEDVVGEPNANDV